MAVSKYRHSLGHRDLTPSQIFLNSVGSSIEVAIDTAGPAFLLLEQDLGRHSHVLVIQQMARKYRHTLTMGSVKFRMRFTEPPYGKFTVSSHAGWGSGTPF